VIKGLPPHTQMNREKHWQVEQPQ